MSYNTPNDAEEILSEFAQTHKTLDEPNVSSTESQESSESTDVESSNSDTSSNSDSAKNSNFQNNSHERNVVLVGTKPVNAYMNATLTQLSTQPTVTIKARGKRITHAVDVSQKIVSNLDKVGYFISDIRISSDSLVSEDGKRRNISSIEIDVSKS